MAVTRGAQAPSLGRKCGAIIAFSVEPTLFHGFKILSFPFFSKRTALFGIKVRRFKGYALVRGTCGCDYPQRMFLSYSDPFFSNQVQIYRYQRRTCGNIFEPPQRSKTEPPHVGDGTPWAQSGSPYSDFVWRFCCTAPPSGQISRHTHREERQGDRQGETKKKGGAAGTNRRGHAPNRQPGTRSKRGRKERNGTHTCCPRTRA